MPFVLVVIAHPGRRAENTGGAEIFCDVTFVSIFCGIRSIGLVAFTKIDMMLYWSLRHIRASDTNVRRPRHAVYISSCSTSCTRNSENTIMADIFIRGEPNWGRFSITKILLLKYTI